MKKVCISATRSFGSQKQPAKKLFDKIGAEKCDGHYRQLRRVMRNREAAGKVKTTNHLLTRQQYANLEHLGLYVETHETQELEQLPILGNPRPGRV